MDAVEEGIRPADPMWAIRRWLAKEHPPLQEHEEDMLMPDMRLSRRWTQENEDQLLADWEEDPSRVYLEHRHINSLKNQLKACKMITDHVSLSSGTHHLAGDMAVVRAGRKGRTVFRMVQHLLQSSGQGDVAPLLPV
jgi:hypothetical protein